jgi:hypothetical protein
MFVARLCAIASRNRDYLSSVEKVTAVLTGVVQFLSQNALLRKAYNHWHEYSQSRKFVISVSAFSWYMDSLDFFTAFQSSAILTKSVSTLMVIGYFIRAHYMMYNGVAGVVPD